MTPHDRICLFALSSSREYGERVASRMGVPLSDHEERSFEDGEHKSRPLVNVRGRDTFVIHSLYGDPTSGADAKLCRILFFIGALKDAGAARVTAVVPYLCYARKDRKTQPRDPVTTRYVASLFEAVGADAVMTIDVHNLAAFQNAFRCRTDHLEAKMLFVKHFAGSLPETELAVVSPDVGGVKRATLFREALARATGRPVASAFMEKQRARGVVTGEALVGDVGGCTAIIFDDLISSGTTMARAAKACRTMGAQRVYAAATHGLFMGQAGAVLLEAGIDKIVVGDTVPPFRLPPDIVRDRLDLLDTAALFAEAIAQVHEGGSIVELLEG